MYYFVLNFGIFFLKIAPKTVKFLFEIHVPMSAFESIFFIEKENLLADMLIPLHIMHLLLNWAILCYE